MRPVVRKKAKPAPKQKSSKTIESESARELVRMRKRLGEALAEVRTARGHMASQYAGPEHEALAEAESILEKCLKGAAR